MERVIQYLAHRRALGYRLYADGYLLRSFARYAECHASGQPLTTKLALEWATEPKSGKRLYHAKRLDALRSFARYLAVFEPRTEIPPTGLLGPSFARTEPHIYTPEETAALMRAALMNKSWTRDRRINPLRNATIIGLLACTGLRIGEVLALKNQDVDLENGIIMVRQSKNLPMRLVPITDCTVDRLRAYLRMRDRCLGPSGEAEAFFESAYGGHFTYRSFSAAFCRIRERAGLNGQKASGRAPRLHDFRHTFACNHLLRAYRENRNIDNAVHELSVYLGHASLHATYWYLTGVPVLFAECLKRFEAQKQRNGGEA
jgi:integrase